MGKEICDPKRPFANEMKPYSDDCNQETEFNAME